VREQLRAALAAVDQPGIEDEGAAERQGADESNLDKTWPGAEAA
jgi:hypothetical protein